MRTIAIIGTDWSGPHPWFVRQPFTDGGRLQFDRMRDEDWANVFFELGGLAQVDGIAVGIRGAYDTGSVDSLPVAARMYAAADPQPTLMPWYDTVGLPDIAGAPGVAHPFDFANPQHIAWGWERYARVFFDHFAEATFERSPRGKVLCAWWGIEPATGHGFLNQRYAQRLLDRVDAEITALGLGGADHIVDQSWVTLVPQLTVYAVHDWFNPWGVPPRASSLRSYNGVTVGVAVPSFYRMINPEGNAETLRSALTAFRSGQADYVLLESGTNFIEGAELMRDASGNTSKLEAIREHIALTHDGRPEDDMPITATFCLRRAERLAHPTRPGYYTSPYPGKPDKVLSVETVTGQIAERPFGANGPWESWREEGNRAVFDDVFGYTFAIPLVD